MSAPLSPAPVSWARSPSARLAVAAATGFAVWVGLAVVAPPDAARAWLSPAFAAAVGLFTYLLAAASFRRGELERELAALNRSLDERTAQRNLREQRFRAIFNSTYQCVGLLDPEGIVLEVNRAALDAGGITADQVLGKPLWAAVWWSHDPALPERIRAAVGLAAAGETVRFKTERFLAGGGIAHVDFTLTPIRDEQGRVVLLVPEGHDVTHLKRAERELFASRERFELALRAAGEGIWDWDLRTNRLFLSEQWKGMLGYADEELPNEVSSWERLVHPDDLARSRKAVADYLAGRTDHLRLEMRMHHRNGNWRWILTRGVAQRDGEGEPIRLTGSHVDVTERKGVEDRLAANEILLRQFIAHAPAAIAMLDKEMRYLRTSERWLTDYHLTGQDIIGRSHYEVFPDLPERWKEVDRRVLGGSVERCEEDPFPRAGGETDWLQWESRPWREAGGEIGGVILFTQVITERKRTEAALRQSEERYRQLVQGVRDYAIFRLDAAGRIASWNVGAQRILGYDTEEILDRPFAIFSASGEDEEGAGIDLPHPSRDGRFESEGWWLRKGGTRFWANVSIAPLRDATGGVRGFAVIARDLTDRRRAEEALRESEERFRGAFDSAPIGMALVSPEGRWLKVNRATCDIVGYPEEEMLRTTSQAITHPDDLESNLGFVRRALAGEVQSYQTEKRYFHKTGRVVSVLLSVSLVRDSSGEPLYFVTQIEDISERKRAQAELIESLHEKEVMLREIHHRVKNNLAIVASLFQLQSVRATDAETVRILREAQDRVRSMALVHEHLYNSDSLAAIRFHEYARSLAEEVFQTYHLPDRTITLRTEIEPAALSVEQAIPCGLLLNELLTNCLKHAFAGGTSGEVLLKLRHEDGVCSLSVADNGRGMPDDRDAGGVSSLGMQLIRSLTRQLGGRIEFVPREPGTEARLVFPIET
jgi:PAS domain S-box-containing protein